MKKQLSELYTHGGNFYSGKRLGTDGADAKFSSYIASKKAYPPDDYDENNEENEMTDSILNKRRRNKDGSYKLEDTITSVNEASATGDAIETAISDLLQGVVDETTGELGGLVRLGPLSQKIFMSFTL